MADKEIIGQNRASSEPASGHGAPAPHATKCGGIVTLSADDFAKLMAEIEAEKQRRAEKMPDEAAALAQMQEAFTRLKELGFNDAMYCPKDGTAFDAIEAGSTGIHHCHYDGEWPKGIYWISEAGDLWPSQPILYRARDGVGRRGPASALDADEAPVLNQGLSNA